MSRLVCVVAKRGKFRVAEPIFDPGPQLPLRKGPASPAVGEMVLVETESSGASPLLALGSPKNARDVVEALLTDHGVERGFRPAVETEAREAKATARDQGPRRRDLSAMPTFTVDPVTARDFDDAVSAERRGDGVRLWIHIADVAAHVRPGSALEAEAFARATSTYVPGSVEPMLPHTLSSEACSLAPGVERLAVTAEIDLSADGVPSRTEFFRSVIRSDVRLSYEELDEQFAGRARAPETVAGPLAIAREAAAALRERRRSTALEVNSTEPEFEFSDDGDVLGAHGVAQTEAHGLIEQLMILTNERVAEHCERRKMTTLYRVHEQPDPQRIERLIGQLAALEIPAPALPEDLSPRDAGKLAIEASRLVAREANRRGHGADPWVGLVLRSLKQAYYSDQNLGHAGLGSPAYLHFTSPIRRFPDLVAHRALLASIDAGEEEPDPEPTREAGWHSSEREREASRLERDADDICAAFLLRRELGERSRQTEFEGEVAGVVGAGAFVRFQGELADVYEGFLPAREWGGREYFQLDESETALVGRRSGKRLRIGDPVTVSVNSIEAPRGRVDLLPAGRSAEAAEGGDARSRPKPKGRSTEVGTAKGRGKGKGKGNQKGKGKSKNKGKPKPKSKGGGKGKSTGGGKGKRARTGGQPAARKR
ncbi:MAG: RNB domain-containing ribonuclease [Solirubrobacterales bacterium]